MGGLRILIHPDFAGLKMPAVEAALERFDRTARPIARNDVRIMQHELAIENHAPLPVFIKVYDYARPTWRFLGRASKARREYDSYLVFRQLGIRCAQPVACGEVRDAIGRLQRAFIITVAVPDARMLHEYLRDRCPDRSTPDSVQNRKAITQQLAEMLARVHDAGFFHNDLHWRNVLVNEDAGGLRPVPVVWLIDCPRGSHCRFPILRERRQLKDLATLDRGADGVCTLRERVRFVREYLRCAQRPGRAAALMRDVQAYRSRRKNWRK
jgi:tRNA A-37 threonylcarbamoyl transferase component Bud32